jgi:hypothetical protein
VALSSEKPNLGILFLKTVLKAYFGGINLMFTEELSDFRPKFIGVL